MMIKITHKCSMGCTHCMNDATKDGAHMDFSTFTQVIDFQRKNGGPVCFLTGGEPFEHPEFWRFVWHAMCELPYTLITVATNGAAMADPKHAQLIEQASKEKRFLTFQVSTDPRYYPIKIDTSLPVYHLPNVTLVTEIPRIYPQGRAKTNNLPWVSIGSKCCNVRCAARQLNNPTVADITGILFAHDKVCTPHIDANGNIKLGESDLCPVCSSIYKSDREIVSDIINFECHGCDQINKNLPVHVKKVLGVKL